MRKLIGKDTFKVARIIKKSGLKDELENLKFDSKDYTKVGMKILMTIIEALASQGVEEEVFTFLDDVLEVKDTANMDIFELFELIKVYGKENDLKRFLSLVGSPL